MSKCRGDVMERKWWHHNRNKIQFGIIQINTGMHIHKIQKQNPNWDAINYWRDWDPIQLWITWIRIECSLSQSVLGQILDWDVTYTPASTTFDMSSYTTTTTLPLTEDESVRTETSSHTISSSSTICSFSSYSSQHNLQQFPLLDITSSFLQYFIRIPFKLPPIFHLLTCSIK
jgi:hypothetical protein